MEKITYNNTMGQRSTVFAHHADKDNVKGVIRDIKALLVNYSDVKVRETAGGVQVRASDDFKVRIVDCVVLWGDYFYHNGFAFQVIPEISIITSEKNAPTKAGLASISAPEGTVHVYGTNDHLKSIRNSFKYSDKVLQEREATPAASEYGGFVIPEVWSEEDSARLLEFLGKSSFYATVTATVTYSKILSSLKSLKVSHSELSELVKPKDIIIKYNNKYGVIHHKSGDAHPFVD